MKESTVVEKLGLDAAIFLRFTRMCRNIFLVLATFGCGIMIPVNVVGGSGFRVNNTQWSISAFSAMTPQYLFGRALRAFVVCAYLFDITVCYFLWCNYKAVVRLRRAYFASLEYLASLHSRTLMVSEGKCFLLNKPHSDLDRLRTFPRLTGLTKESPGSSTK